MCESLMKWVSWNYENMLSNFSGIIECQLTDQFVIDGTSESRQKTTMLLY